MRQYAESNSETSVLSFVQHKKNGRNAIVTKVILTTFGPRAFIAARTASSEWHNITSLLNRVTHERRRCSPATPHGLHFLAEVPAFVAHALAGTLASNFCSPPRSGTHDCVIIDQVVAHRRHNKHSELAVQNEGEICVILRSPEDH